MNSGQAMTVAGLPGTGETDETDETDDQACRTERDGQDRAAAPDARSPSPQDRPDCQDRLPSEVYGELMRAVGCSGWSCWHAPAS
jgi:hypothetical protein